jgi:hypothetical protein
LSWRAGERCGCKRPYAAIVVAAVTAAAGKLTLLFCRGERVLAFAELELPVDVFPIGFAFDTESKVPNFPIHGQSQQPPHGPALPPHQRARVIFHRRFDLLRPHLPHRPPPPRRARGRAHVPGSRHQGRHGHGYASPPPPPPPPFSLTHHVTNQATTQSLPVQSHAASTSCPVLPLTSLLSSEGAARRPYSLMTP